ncbi:MAG: nucleoside triphosphate pyrophosphohydrolase [Spirochaetales bacterium]|nr:nucleoside triphosphate pyrophosphohydrolase [Spirochaetales bacterium]
MNSNINTTNTNPADNSSAMTDAFMNFFEIIRTLRAPGGCPWDREQTPETIKGNLLEEAYESYDAITSGDTEHIREELGDMYLLVTMLSYMYQQQNTFSIADVLDGISDKLKRRHPHVFSDSSAQSSTEVLHQWDEIKQEKEGRKHHDSVLQSVPRHVPPMERSYRLQKKAAKSGFDWNDLAPVLSKIEEEIHELKEVIYSHDKDTIRSEIGDVLFSVINLARFLKIEPDAALHETNRKFENRFTYVEKEMKKTGTPMVQGNLPEMDRLWNEAKTLKAD